MRDECKIRPSGSCSLFIWVCVCEHNRHFIIELKEKARDPHDPGAELLCFFVFFFVFFCLFRLAHDRLETR